MFFAKLVAAMLCCQFTVEVVPNFTVSVEQPPPVQEAPKVQRRFLAMFTAKWCGPCQNWKRNILPQLTAAGYYVQIHEMTDPAKQAKYGTRISRYPTFVACDYEDGAWVSDPIIGGIDLATAKRMLGRSDRVPVKQVASLRQTPPVRFIQWPGWGTIDLETYNRDCNCSMCVSIRFRQQEYRKQLKAFQQSQTKVTPDQEGCPHAVVEAMLDQMEILDSDVLGDMGCGDGRILIAAARRGIAGIGIEIDPARAEVARRNVRSAGYERLVRIEEGDALDFDMSRVTVATTFLYPPMLAKLAPRMKSLRVVASPFHEIPGLSMVQTGDVWIRKQ